MENIESQPQGHINHSENMSPLKKVGDFIREARQGRSLSIEELSGSLRIGQEQLTALENGQEDLLPEKVFVKAMIRRVSEKLDLDTNFILEEFNGRNLDSKRQYAVNKLKSKKTITPALLSIVILISATLGVIASFLTINFLEDSLPSESSKSNSLSSLAIKN